MKTKNQTGQPMPELAISKAANDDAIPPKAQDGSVATGGKPSQAWSPFEVWRTRVRAHAPHARGESTPR